MPQVVEREIFKHGPAMGREARESVEKHLRVIRALVGETPGISLPTDEEFATAVESRLRALEHLIVRAPFETDIALRALDRVDLKQPPAQTSQQFKDSAIWEHCLILAKDYSVHLVTADKAFYHQGAYSRGLEARLLEELARLGLSVHIYSALDQLLAELAENITSSFDVNAAADAVQASILDKLRSSVESSNWTLGERSDARIEAFVTEKYGVLSVNFEFKFELTAEVEPHQGRAAVTGQCLYRPSSHQVDEVRLGELRMAAQSPEGASEKVTVFGYMSGTIGGRAPDRHRVRAPLPGGNEFRATTFADSVTVDDSFHIVQTEVLDDRNL